MEARNRETMTQIKIESALLCQQNTELKNEIKERDEENDKLLTRLYFFKDLDLERVQLATTQYDQLELDYQKIKQALRASDLERSNMQTEHKAYQYNCEQYEYWIGKILKHNKEVLKELQYLRTEIQSEDLKESNETLN